MAETTPSYLRALGRSDPPAEFDLTGERFVRRLIYKHDFFAVTALYESEQRKAILKTGRTAALAVFPMRWIGRLLAAREAACLSACEGVVGVPRLLGRIGPTAIVREYIDGRPLKRGMAVADDFHFRLRSIIDQIHAKGMAYVDLEKAENVLVGADGKPYLIDFQIAWYWPRRLGGDLLPMRLMRRWFQSGDLYHLRKLHRRTRPDQLSPEERQATYRRPWFLRLHTVAAGPWRRVRRFVLNWLDPRRGSGERGRIAEDSLGGP